MVQINVTPVPAFQIPNTSGTVTNVANVAPPKPAREEGDEGGGGGGGGGGAGGSPGSGYREQSESPPTQRREVERRTGEDRRKLQVAVLLDTRVGERRKTQRRVEDPPAPAVDLKV